MNLTKKQRKSINAWCRWYSEHYKSSLPLIKGSKNEIELFESFGCSVEPFPEHSEAYFFLHNWLVAFADANDFTKSDLKNSVIGLTIDQIPDYDKEGYRQFRKMSWVRKVKLMEKVIRENFS